MTVTFDVLVWRGVVPENDFALGCSWVYAAYSALLFSSGLSAFSQAPYPDPEPLHLLGHVLEVMWWLMGARLLSLALDTLLLPPSAWRRQRLFQDGIGALLVLAAVVAALGFVLEPVRGLVVTSVALTNVLSLGMQSTLSDVRRYCDQYDGADGVEVKVLEMNWCATHLLTSQTELLPRPHAKAIMGLL